MKEQENGYASLTFKILAYHQFVSDLNKLVK